MQANSEHDSHDELVPDPEVAKEFGVSLMSLWRWDHDPDLGFPTAIKIRGRNYRSRRELELFKARKLRDAVAHRLGKKACKRAMVS